MTNVWQSKRLRSCEVMFALSLYSLFLLFLLLLPLLQLKTLLEDLGTGSDRLDWQHHHLWRQRSLGCCIFFVWIRRVEDA